MLKALEHWYTNESFDFFPLHSKPSRLSGRWYEVVAINTMGSDLSPGLSTTVLLFSSFLSSFLPFFLLLPKSVLKSREIERTETNETKPKKRKSKLLRIFNTQSALLLPLNPSIVLHLSILICSLESVTQSLNHSIILRIRSLPFLLPYLSLSPPFLFPLYILRMIHYHIIMINFNHLDHLKTLPKSILIDRIK